MVWHVALSTPAKQFLRCLEPDVEGNGLRESSEKPSTHFTLTAKKQSRITARDLNLGTSVAVPEAGAERGKNAKDNLCLVVRECAHRLWSLLYGSSQLEEQ